MPSSTVEPLFSLDLRAIGGRGAGPDGRDGWLTSTDTALVSLNASGDRRWEAPFLGDLSAGFLRSEDGAIIAVEGDHVVVRDVASGRVTGSFPAPKTYNVTLDPWGGLLFTLPAPGGVERLLRTTRTGEPSWTVPLTAPAWSFPTTVGDRVFAWFGGLLRALDHDGRVRWAVSHEGFHDPGADAGDEQLAPPAAVGPHTLLAGFRWHDGHGLFLIDTEAHTVERYASDRGALHPLTVLPHAGGDFRVAMYAGRREVRDMEYEHLVVVLDAHGETLWTHALPTKPTTLTHGADGTLIVSSTPTQKRWDDYHRWQDLSKDTYIRCFGADGEERWIWYAPGPQTQPPRLTPNGVIYLTSDGRLWVLPSR